MKTCDKCGGTGKVPTAEESGAEVIRAMGDLSSSELARRLGFSRSYICDLRKGRRPAGPNLLRRIRKATKP